jgi:hypothetical protein
MSFVFRQSHDKDSIILDLIHMTHPVIASGREGFGRKSGGWCLDALAIGLFGTLLRVDSVGEISELLTPAGDFLTDVLVSEII